MSDNFEIVRRHFKARSAADVDALAREMNTQVELDLTRSRAPYQGLYRGHEAISALVQTLKDAWDEIVWEPEELIEAGDRVVAVIRMTGRGKGSGIQTRARGANVFTIHAGKIVRIQVFQDKREALEVLDERGE
jgi:ketosteroid isomerase-like protein